MTTAELYAAVDALINEWIGKDCVPLAIHIKFLQFERELWHANNAIDFRHRGAPKESMAKPAPKRA